MGIGDYELSSVYLFFLLYYGVKILMKSYISYIDLIPYLVAQVHVLRISDNRRVTTKYTYLHYTPDTEHTYI